MECNDICTVVTHEAAPICITQPQYWMMKYCTDSSRLFQTYWAQGRSILL